MDGVSFEPDHPKKRRRRDHNERILSARLLLDDSLRGNIGVVSEDLWVELGASDIDNHGIISMKYRPKIY
jgi:hypothetical protein